MIEVGAEGAVELTVSEDDTAVAFRSGSVPVLATPRVVALVEEASVVAIRDGLAPGETTVGMRIQLDHLAPTPVGASVRAEAHLEKIEGRRLTFTVSVTDGRGLVAVGKVTRVVVDEQRFLERVG